MPTINNEYDKFKEMVFFKAVDESWYFARLNTSSGPQGVYSGYGIDPLPGSTAIAWAMDSGIKWQIGRNNKKLL